MRPQAKNALDAKKVTAHVVAVQNTRDIIESIGRDAIAERLQVAPRRVDRARTEPRIAASWYAALSEMAGQDLPRHLFTFKGINHEGYAE